MTRFQSCVGAPTLASMLPLEVLYFATLATYVFFLFFASFVYRRARTPAIGRLAGTAMLLAALYTGASLLMYDIHSAHYFLLATKLKWLGASMATAFWVHMTALLRQYSRFPQGQARLTKTQTAIVGLAYAGGAAFMISGVFLPGAWSAWLFNYSSISFSPWPTCLWHPLQVESGPFYPAFGVYVAAYLLFSLAMVYQATLHSKRRAQEASTEQESFSAFVERSRHFRLLSATVILTAAGILITLTEQGVLDVPLAFGQLLLLIGGAIAGLAISYGNVNDSDAIVVSAFYRAAASIGVLVLGILAVVYAGERGHVHMGTLLGLSTIGVLFFTHVELWWRLIDNLLLGPHAAQERARIRTALEEPVPDHDFLRTRVVYQRWSSETRHIFLDIGRGHSRSTIAKERGVHISTVDFHIRRIKDTLETARLEEIRALAHHYRLCLNPSSEDGGAEVGRDDQLRPAAARSLGAGTDLL